MRNNINDFLYEYQSETLLRHLVHILLAVTDDCPSWISGRENESMWPDQVPLTSGS